MTSVPSSPTESAVDAEAEDEAEAAGSAEHRTDVVWFAADIQAAALARAQARSTLLLHGVDAAAITQAELLVTEVVTNVVRHTASPRVGVTVHVRARSLRVEAREDTITPVPDHAGRAIADVPVSATSGRGMGLVDWLASTWGVTRSGRVTTTWFEIALDDAGRSLSEVPAAGMTVAAISTLDHSGVLLRIAEALGRATTAEQVADVVTHTLREPLGALFVGIALADRDDATMRYLSLDPLPPETAARWVVFPLDGASPVSRVALDATPRYHATPEQAEREFPGLAVELATAGSSAIAHLPLTSAGATFGTLALAWTDPHEVDAETRVLLMIVAGYAAQALARR